MPKKTKKQKIAAAKRKHTVFLQSEFNNFKVETPSIKVLKTEVKKETGDYARAFTPGNSFSR